MSDGIKKGTVTLRPRFLLVVVAAFVTAGFSEKKSKGNVSLLLAYTKTDMT